MSELYEKILHLIENPIEEGIRYDISTNTYIFDFKRDNPGTDLMYLGNTNRNNKIYKTKGLPIYYAYEYVQQPKRPSFDSDSDDDEYKYDKVKFDNNSLRNFLKSKTPGDEKIKSPTVSGGIDAIFNKMIDNALIRFNKHYDLNSFDLIVAAPSSSKLNDMILNRLKSIINNPDIIIKNIFIKNMCNKIKRMEDEYNKADAATKRRIDSTLIDLIKKDPQIPYEVKMINPPWHRKYFSNFIIVNSDVTTKKILKRLHNNAKILIVDDTVGSKATFMEIVRELQQFNPKELVLFALLKDF